MSIKAKINMFMHLLKNTKPYSVVDMFDEKGNYDFSVIVIHSGFNSLNNFVRIKYDKRECEIKGEVPGKMKKYLTQ